MNAAVKRQVTLRVDPTELETLHQEAHRSGTSIQKYLLRLVAADVDRHQNTPPTLTTEADRRALCERIADGTATTADRAAWDAAFTDYEPTAEDRQWLDADLGANA